MGESAESVLKTQTVMVLDLLTIISGFLNKSAANGIYFIYRRWRVVARHGLEEA